MPKLMQSVESTVGINIKQKASLNYDYEPMTTININREGEKCNDIWKEYGS